MAVVTQGTRRLGSVMRMRRQVFQLFLMTRKARLISVHSHFELFLRIAFVHGMATHTSQFALLITGALDEAVELASGNTDHSVGPKEIIQNIWMFCQDVGQPGLLGQFGRTNNRRSLFEIIAGPKSEAVLAPARGAIEPFHAVAKSTDLRRANVIQVRWLDNFSRRLTGTLFAPPPAFEFFMILARSVTGLTGDA